MQTSSQTMHEENTILTTMGLRTLLTPSQTVQASIRGLTSCSESWPLRV